MAEAFTLRFEHASGEGMRDAALAATMYRLEVHLGDRCLTQALDKANRGVVEGTYVSLLPVAIWAVDCWWLLAHEGARGTVERRHAI